MKESMFSKFDKIKYEGPESKNPLAFRWYDENRIVGGKTLKEQLRFAIAYWHSFCADGSDQFGTATHVFPWSGIADPVEQAKAKMDSAFDFFVKIGAPYYCFHDVDLIREGQGVAAYEKNMQTIVDYAKQKQKETGIKLLWGTANVFSHSRYMNGAATNPDFGAVAYAGTQIKNAIDATIALGGENYVFWGGTRRVHVPAEYRYEAGERTSGDDVDDGAGLRPSQRIQRNFPRRAQTYGTHQTSV